VKWDINRRDARFGLDHLSFVSNPPRHQHLHAYATVVIAGAFEQYSYAGRLKLQAGDVLIKTRAIKALTGISPAKWRVHIGSRRTDHLAPP
jgi:hypothetical protein